MRDEGGGGGDYVADMGFEGGVHWERGVSGVGGGGVPLRWLVI